MGKTEKLSRLVGYLLFACVCVVHSTANSGSKEKSAKELINQSPSAPKVQSVWTTAPTKIALKRETLPIPGSKSGKSESLRTASQTLFGYNGNNQNGFGQGSFGGSQFGGFGSGGFSPSYTGGNGYNQYSQLGNAYNILGQNGGFGGQAQNPYYNNGYFGGAGGYNQYPFATTGGAYPFGNAQGGFGFNGFNSGYNTGFFPGAQYQGQIGNRNFGFINQGFGNPAFRNPQSGQGISSSSAGINSIPNQVQVGTGLEVGSRGFNGNVGGFPSASGQQYIVGNGIGQPAFIGGLMDGSGNFGGFSGFGGPYAGMYLPSHQRGIPGGVYRHPNSLFGPYDYPRSLSSGTPSPASITAPRPSIGSTRLQTTGPSRYYQGVNRAGSYSPSANTNSRERLYRYTSSNEG